MKCNVLGGDYLVNDLAWWQMTPWLERPTIDIDLSLAGAARFAHVPAGAIDQGKRLLQAVLQEVPAAARFLADWVRLRTANRFQAEAVTLAHHVGASWRDVVLANVSYDLVLASLGCSTVALPTPRGPVLARNMDWWPENLLAQASYLVRCLDGGHLRFVNAGWPGAIGVVTGLSVRGFAVALNAVMGKEGVRKTGYPVLLHLRRVIEDAPDFQEALQMLSHQTLAAPALFTLVGSRNEDRVVIERTPTRHALRWPDAGAALVTTNDYRLLERPETHDALEIYQTTCSRYEALCTFFADHHPDHDVEDTHLLYVLSDEAVIQSITCQHVIMRPASGEARLFVPRRLVQGE
jgi:hypothetical protein